MDLETTGALVTGGSGAIGTAVVEELAGAGADVTVAYHTDEEGARTAAERARERGVRAQVADADLTDPDAAAELVDAAAGFAELGVVVNCVGGVELSAVEDLAPDALRRSFAVNVESALNVVGPAVERMRADRDGNESGNGDRGTIVNLSSVAAEIGTVGVPYAGAKAGIVGCTRALARELGPEGIRANVVSPGAVDSQMNDEIVEHLEGQRFRGHEAVDTLLDRYEARPDEVASAVRFLAEHEFVTGEVLHVDGGMSL